MLPVFDGHNDVLLYLAEKKDEDGGVRRFLDGDMGAHIDLKKARSGGFAGGLFAVFVPTSSIEDDDHKMQGQRYDLPLAKPLDIAPAQKATAAMMALLDHIVQASDGAVRKCRSVADIRTCMKAGAMAAVLHFEGVEQIDAGLTMLETYHSAGLRSLGPVWSRPNIFGHGVRFRYPSSPDTDPGLTEAGKALVKACNELRIAIDLSHLTEKGFWDVANSSSAPLIASHSNAHALCKNSRNLTDKQLAAIKDSGGLVGINFVTCFLREDGQMTDASLDDIVRHADYLIERLGEGGVGLGSDYGSVKVPQEIGDISKLQKLVQAFRSHGYNDALLRKICSENWLNVLERIWGE